MQLTADRLRTNASKCRDLASTAITGDARDILASMAIEYESEASALERARPASRRAFVWPL